MAYPETSDNHVPGGHKPQGSDHYQVLYGDLRVEKGVAETDAPNSSVKE